MNTERLPAHYEGAPTPLKAASTCRACLALRKQTPTLRACPNYVAAAFAREVEAGHRREDLFEKRRDLAEERAKFFHYSSAG